MLVPSGDFSDDYDVCVVGAGPVGLSLALECEARGLSVLLLEAGRQHPGREEETCEEIADPARHAPLNIATSRSFGGTSWRWGGRCVPLDEIDFERRSYVNESGWPISQDDIAPWYEQAARYLDCGSASFVHPPADDWELAGAELKCVERWAREPRLALVHREAVYRSRRISLVLERRAVGICLEPQGSRVDALKVVGERGPVAVRARSFVLACGGLEATRLLLLAQRQWPRHFGGVGGPLGRYYTGHATGAISSIVLNSPSDIDTLDFWLDETKTFIRRRFSIEAAQQRRHALLNTVFWADNPPLFDAAHGNGALSLIYLVLACPYIARRMVAEGIRLRYVGTGPRRWSGHLRNLLRDSPQAARDLAAVIGNRFMSRHRKPDLVLRNGAGRYSLQYHAEATPDPESRVQLSSRVDRDGVPALSIDLRFGVDDARSILRAHELLDHSLRQSGRGRVEYWCRPEERVDAISVQASDGYHQIGTTRMSASPRRGIVDGDCRVHGVDNLYIASSSIFPTAGQANPTFPAAAFAVRLASRLAREAAAERALIF